MLMFMQWNILVSYILIIGGSGNDMKFLRMRNTKGFTLLEILIVLVIIAILAGLAVPAYQASVEKSRAQEALQALTAVRESMIREHARANSYAAATFTANQPGTLDYNPNVAVGGQTLYFTPYVLSGLGVNTFTCTATSPQGTVAINQAGVITRTGAYQ